MWKNVYSEYDQSKIDYRVNKYTIKCLTVTVIGMLAMWLANVLNIFIVNMELLSKGIFLAAITVFITIVIGKCVDLHKPWVKYFLIFNTVVAITILGITLTYHTVLLSVLPLLLASQYTNGKMIIYTYLLSVVSVFAIVMGGYFWGLCDANMLTLTTNPMSYYINQATEGIYFENINSNPWYTLILYFVIPRCILLLLMLPVIRSISANILDYVVYAGSMKRLSERDEMTGLYNKNKFLHMIKESYSKLNSVGVIFLDVNNLKEVNDNLGHDQGDFVISKVAHMIMGLTNERRKAYRTGGDEFIMIIENPVESEIEQILQKMSEDVKKDTLFQQMEFSVAMGWACGKGTDIDDIVKEADQKMYLKKHEQKAGKS